MAMGIDKVDKILSVIDRALAGGDYEPPARWSPPVNRSRWWCPDHDVIREVLATELLRPKCDDCGEWMQPYNPHRDDPTNAPAYNWSPE
jgi:hypothetical protein